MFGFSGFAFDSPWFLLLLVLLPTLWIFSFQSLSGLGPFRRLFALGLRTAVLLLLIASLAETQIRKKSDRLTVLYLLDQSLSIPGEQRQAMLQYVAEDVREHRNSNREDMAGVIVFGRDATIEVPPFDDDLPTTGQVESLISFRQDATNLAGALKLALATFPEDSAKRIVVVTDGNENIGNSQEMAAILSERGISIYVVPIHLQRRGEVSVEKVAIPTDVRKGQPFDVRVVIQNDNPGRDSATTAGRLILTRRTGQNIETIAEMEVELPAGKKVFTLRENMDRADFYTYEVGFVPTNVEDDLLTQNNRASAFSHVRGKGQVLLIEDWKNEGEFDFLVQRLKAMNLEVAVQGSDQLFTSLAELQRFDTVILANVPRSSGSSANEVTHFSDRQIEMLVHNVHKMGAGLVMLGGPNSFGVGGWQNTELEKAMPVDFQIRNAEVVPVGAFVMTMHASEMAQGNHWQKVIAQEALKALGPQDYCGIVHYSMGGDGWLWNNPDGLIQVAGNRKSMLAKMNRMTPGDMPAFDPGMRLAAAGFAKIPDAGIKHMIIISDGDPSKPQRATIDALKKLGVKVSTVAVGTHGAPGSTLLQDIAQQTGGKYYVVTNPKALPRIYQREARRVARPLIKEKIVQPSMFPGHEMLRGIDTQPPPISGFVMTTVKQNPLVEVSMISPDPPIQKNATLLASWTYGLGRTVAFTSDAGRRWTHNWTEWEYDKLFSQMVTWSMRPVMEDGKFTVATDIKNGKVRVIVTALDQDDELLNFLSISGSVVDPKMDFLNIPFDQTAPGRYVGEFDADKAGSYFLTMTVPNPASGSHDSRPITIRTGVNVPYSAEFRDRVTNAALLETLSKQVPRGGQPGKVMVGSFTASGLDDLLKTDTFKHDLKKALSNQDIWPLLTVLASCVFLADIFVRRVSIHFYWLAPVLAAVRDRMLQRRQEPVQNERLQRLRSRKQKLEAQIDERRAATPFEISPDPDVLLDAGQPAPDPREPGQAQNQAEVSSTEDPLEETYTERLLRAKKKVWTDKDKEQP
jgi:uncharacterized membrane protein/Mg-chelatase subunit ChlD